MLNKTLLPVSYLAPISYYAILSQNPNCFFEFHENFVKQSIRNRSVIYGANGKLMLTIPKKREKNNLKTSINNIKISYDERWQQEHWNAIESSYNSSPFFKYYKDRIKPFFNFKEPYLITFNIKLQQTILNLLNIKVKFSSSSSYIKNGNFIDYRNNNFESKKNKLYDQVFMEKHGFIPNLSIIDLLFNLGPETSDYLLDFDVKSL